MMACIRMLHACASREENVDGLMDLCVGACARKIHMCMRMFEHVIMTTTPTSHKYLFVRQNVYILVYVYDDLLSQVFTKIIVSKASFCSESQA